jgi:hypothetical protein
MNSLSKQRADHCQHESAVQRPWIEHGPFLQPEDEPLESELLDRMLDEDFSPEDWSDEFFD